MDSQKPFFRHAPGRLEWLLAGLLTLAAVSLHVYYWIHVGGLWRDEVNSINLSERHSLAEMERDSFPIFTLLLMHAWQAVGLGHSDLCLRLFGLLVGLGMLAVLWVSSWKIRRAPPLCGLVLFGLNSTVFFFGDSLRPYGLGSLFAMALTASAFIFLQRPSDFRAAWLALFAVLSVQTLYHNAVLVAAVCLGGWAVCWRRANGRAAAQILLAAVLAAASLLPYAHNLIAAGNASVVLRTGVSFPRFFASYSDTLGFPRSGYIYVWALLYAMILICVCAGFMRRGKSPAGTEVDGTEGPGSGNDLSLFAAVTLAVAVIGFPLFFWRAQMPMQSWYLLPLMASAVVCFDAALPVFRGVLRVIFVVFVVATAWFSIPETGAILEAHFSSVNMYARQLTKEAAPDDYIIVVPWFLGITFDHYFKGATPWDTLPPLADHSTHRFDLVQLQLQNTNAIAPVLAKIGRTLDSGHRVWILAADGWMGVPRPGMTPPATLPPAPLPDTGWSDWPYTRVWVLQVACFTADHSSQFQQSKSVSTDRFITENVDFYVAQGRTNAAGR